MKIGFLGLGNMGSGIAGRLVEAGHEVTVWNRTREKAAGIVEKGARQAENPEDAVRDADVVMTMLMDDASVRGIFEKGKALEAMRKDATHLCLMTISPGCADWLAEAHAKHGSRYVSGPVVGRPEAAQNGTLLEFLAGDAAGIVKVEPVCKAFTARIIKMEGAASRANKQKLCVNLFIASLVESLAENYTYAEKIGASREIMAGFFEGAFALPGLKSYAKRMESRDGRGEDGFRMTGGAKDVRLILEEARIAGCRVELAEIIADKMGDALALGMGDRDWSAIQEVSRKRAGLDSK